MAHELFINNGKASMMYYGEAPWHGLGTKLEKPATSAEAIETAGLDWKVRKEQLYLSDGKIINDYYATVRNNGEKPVVLGIVKSDYTILQNSEAFGFFEGIVQGGKALFHTAGALLDGRVIWILAKLPDTIIVKKDDITDKYLLLSNSHDGTSSVRIKFTPIRVVCNNTLTMAMSSGNYFSVLHRKDIKTQLRELPKLMGLIDKRYQTIEESFKKMAGIQVNSKKLQEYLKKVFPGPKNREDETALERTVKNRQWSEYFFACGKGNTENGVSGTLWAAYNGVTEYVDHKSTRASDDSRLNSIWFGNGYYFKARAYKEALGIMRGRKTSQTELFGD